MCNSFFCCDFHRPLTARFCCSPAFDRAYSRSRAFGGVGGGGGGGTDGGSGDGGGNSRNSADITFSHYLATPFSVHLILLLCFRVGSLRIQTVVAGAAVVMAFVLQLMLLSPLSAPSSFIDGVCTEQHGGQQQWSQSLQRCCCCW